MSSRKCKINIFLADLTHTGIRIATESFPLNIGLIASYALKKFGKDVSIKLFKYPDKLLYALQHEECNVLGCSTYIWNNNLSEWACTAAKKINPDIITVRGGWNFPLDDLQREQYLRKHKFTDIFVVNEGEIAFANILERLMGLEDISQWRHSPLDGCVFLNHELDNIFIKGAVLPRIENPGEIPSPYFTGLLDEFFDGNLTPMIETTRGCPFRCNYCNNSNNYYNKVNFFPPEYVIEEINYIAKRIQSKGIRNLTIADTNFGMYPRDKTISLALKETQEKYNWPLGILVSTGKNHVEKIVDATDPLGEALIISMSVQSMNQDTLKIIKRDNIKLDMYKAISDTLIKKERSPMAEVIVPLPGETYATYMAGVEKLIDIGAKKIVSYTLQLNNGTVYKDDAYREKYGYSGKYRLIPYDFGTYGGSRVFDYEEVGTFTRLLSFDDYLNIRRFALVTELMFNNSIFSELLKYLLVNNISNYDILKYILNELEYADKTVRNAFDSFVSETKNELKESEKDLIAFYSRDENYERLIQGEFGGNVIFKHKGMILGRCMTEWIDYVFECAGKLMHNAEAARQGEAEILALKSFVTARLDGLFAPVRTESEIVLDFHYDILSWLTNGNGGPLGEFKAGSKVFRYRFYFSEAQKVERNDLFRRYGSDVSGFAKIQARVPALERLFRKVDAVVIR